MVVRGIGFGSGFGVRSQSFHLGFELGGRVGLGWYLALGLCARCLLAVMRRAGTRRSR